MTEIFFNTYTGISWKRDEYGKWWYNTSLFEMKVERYRTPHSPDKIKENETKND